MNLIKLRAMFILIAFMGLAFTACDEDTTDPTAENPVISNITPPFKNIGDVITITGTDFGSEYDEGSVYFGDVQATGAVGGTDSEYKSWTDTEIQVVIPEGIFSEGTTGLIAIKVYNGATSRYSATVNYHVGVQAQPAAVTDLMATSKDASTVLLKWTASTSASDADFKGYTVKVLDEGGNELSSNDVTTTAYEATGLTAGTKYTFQVYATYAAGGMSTVTEIMWSPALRFGATTKIKMYEYASDKGSSIDLFESGEAMPVTVTATNVDKASFALNTKDGALEFQVGSAISIGSKTPQTTEMSAYIVYPVTTLEEVFDSQALSDDAFEWSSTYADLTSDVGTTGNAVCYIRTKEPDTPTMWTYAKVMLVRSDGGEFLQGTAPDRYVECEISFQKVAGVPYAKTR